MALVGVACDDTGTASGTTTSTTTTEAPALTQPFSPGGAAAGLDLIREAIDGPLVVRQVALYNEYMFAEVRDPRILENLDEYSVRDGRVTGHEPVQLTGDAKNLTNLFAAEAVNWNAISDVAARGGEVIGFEGETTHVVVQLDTSSMKRGVIAMGFVNGPRRSGQWYADSTGAVYDTNIN